MRAHRKSNASSLRVRFSGSELGRAHARWYRTIADHYDALYDARRVERAYPFLHDLLRRYGPVVNVLDVACGTFALDLPLLRRGYRVIGRDLSKDMIRVARHRLAGAGRTADVGVADMRTIDLPQRFDAILCLGTAFNYLVTASDVRRALAGFRRHLRVGGVLVLDLTNFDAWVRRPQNARAEADYRTPDGARIAVFTFNSQHLRNSIHFARFLTVFQAGQRIDVSFDEARLRIWTKSALAEGLRRGGFLPAEWWGDLRLGAKYERFRSPRMVCVAVRS